MTIIIPAFNEEAYLAACLESIQKAGIPDGTDIVVVDNGSTDATAEVARTFPGVIVVSEPEKGTSSARQRGYLTATGNILIFIDADSRISAQWLSNIRAHFSQYPDTVCLSGPYLCYDLPILVQIPAILYWWLLAWPASWFTGVAVGGGMAIRRSALEKAGGFDTSLTFFGDDTNTALRLKPFGRVRFHPRLVTWSSARRFKKEGLLRTVLLYVGNFFSQTAKRKSITAEHMDVR